VRETTLQTPRPVKKGGGRRCSRCRSRESFIADRAEDHGEAGCAPAVHGGPWWSRSPPVAHGRDPTPEQWFCGSVDPWREKPTPGEVCWQGL